MTRLLKNCLAIFLWNWPQGPIFVDVDETKEVKRMMHLLAITVNLIGVTWQVAIYFNKKCVLPNSPIGELFRKLCCKFQQFEIDSVMTLTLECFVRTWVRWRPTLVLYQFKSVKHISA